MKKILSILALSLLLTACGASADSGSGSGSGQQGGDSGEGSGGSSGGEGSGGDSGSGGSGGYTNKFTFISDGELYLDFNFDNAPAGLAININNVDYTTSGKVKMSQNFTYEVKGTFTEEINIYYAVEIPNFASAAGIAEGIEASFVKYSVEKYLKNFSEKQYEYRVYLCLSDKDKGWSKTLAGVDETIKQYAPTASSGE